MALNGQEVKIVKVKGQFPWHHHEHDDELFLVWKDNFRVEFRDYVVSMDPGECVVVQVRLLGVFVAGDRCDRKAAAMPRFRTYPIDLFSVWALSKKSMVGRMNSILIWTNSRGRRRLNFS